MKCSTVAAHKAAACFSLYALVTIAAASGLRRLASSKTSRQDGCLPSEEAFPFCARGRAAGCGNTIFGTRQQYLKRSTLTWRAHETDGPAQAPHDSLDDSKPEAVARSWARRTK
jgi:hypothetical protein